MLVVELCPAGRMSTLVIFIGDWSLYMKPLRNFGYIKMYSGLWDRDWTIRRTITFRRRFTQHDAVLVGGGGYFFVKILLMDFNNVQVPML